MTPLRRPVVHAIRRWLAARDLRVLLAALAVAAGTWGYVELAGSVREGETQRIDESILRAMRDPADPARPIGPPWLAEAGRDITALGGVVVLCLVTLGVAGFLILRRQFGALALLLIATLGGW